MLGQEPQARLVVHVLAEVWGGDDVLGQCGALQQRAQVVLPALGGQLGTQEQRDHLRFAARPQPPHARHLTSTSVAVSLSSWRHPALASTQETAAKAHFDRPAATLAALESPRQTTGWVDNKSCPRY